MYVKPHTFPARRAFGSNEMGALISFLQREISADRDPGYGGPESHRYAEEFSAWMGGGYSIPVNSGTSALYIALMALELEPGTEVLTPAIADPGILAAILAAGLVPRLYDLDSGSFKTSLERIEARLSQRTSAVILVHHFGMPADAEPIARYCRKLGLGFIEDCSQAHGAQLDGNLVGAFGDFAVFSTMFSKTIQTGGTGGIVHCKEERLYERAVLLSDRGKPKFQADFDPRDPTTFIFASMNYTLSDMACAVGRASLSRLPETLRQRRSFLRGLLDSTSSCRHLQIVDLGSQSSPFILPLVIIEPGPTRRSRVAALLSSFGVPHNADYRYLVSQWPWAAVNLSDDFATPNAAATLSASLMLYVNEEYGEIERKVVSDAVMSADEVLHHDG